MPNLRDVAQHAGVSLATASRVASGSTSVRAETRERVERASALLVVGSSVMVHSGYRLCTRAAESGKPLAALNAGKTRADHLYCLKAEHALQDMLPGLARMLLGEA